jgi:DNA-binding NarL/FixJ family response regulator
MSEYSILFIRPEDAPAQNIESAVRAGFDAPVEWTRVDALFDGLRTLRERSFDLIITELFLPDGQGLATVRHLNQHAPRTPVILLCNAKDRETAVTAVRKGAHDFFCYEDLDTTNLCRAVSSAVRNSASEKADSGAADRRNNARFPCRLAVSYQALEHPFLSGVATSETLNISSKGVLFATEEPLQPGQLLQVSVDWPARLENQVPLKLVAEGRIVRNVNGLAAMRIDKYEFRTRRIKAQNTAASGAQPFGIQKTRAETSKPSSQPEEAARNVLSGPGTAAGNKMNGAKLPRNI